jgi:hypothetical protein
MYINLARIEEISLIYNFYQWMKKLNILHDISERLKGIDNDMPKFLEKFYQSTIINEIKKEDMNKYKLILKELTNESLFNQLDKDFIKDLIELIGPWCSSNQKLYYDIIHERAVWFKRPFKNSREYYAYIMTYMKI